jgi:signal peptidase I
MNPWLSVGLSTAGLAGGLAAFVRRRYVAVQVHGCSMEPALRAGDRVLVRRRRIDQVRRGQIVVLANRGALDDDPPWLVKRVAAAPGDPVPRADAEALRLVTEDEVPQHRLVLLGDNRAASFDSRRAGYFDADALLGVVVKTLR